MTHETPENFDHQSHEHNLQLPGLKRARVLKTKRMWVKMFENKWFVSRQTQLKTIILFLIETKYRAQFLTSPEETLMLASQGILIFQPGKINSHTSDTTRLLIGNGALQRMGKSDSFELYGASVQDSRALRKNLTAIFDAKRHFERHISSCLSGIDFPPVSF